MQGAAVAYSPSLTGRPVRLFHLGTNDSPEGKKLAACCGEPFLNPLDIHGIKEPIVMCPGCQMTLGRE